MTNAEGFAPNQILMAALSTWIVFFLSSLVGATVSSGLLGIPLGTVVDVLLSLQLAVLALFAFATVVAVLGQLVRGQISLSFLLSGVGAIFITAFHPFAAVAGYRTYALVVGTDITDADFIYLPLVQLYVTALAEVGFLPDAMLMDPMVLGLAPVDPPRWSALTDAMARVEIALMAASLTFSLLATFLLRLPKGHREAWP